MPGWDLHPLENAALARRTPKADIHDATRRIASRMAEATLPNKPPVGATPIPAQNRPTNREDCHAKCDPELESPAIAERATVSPSERGYPGNLG